MAISTEKLREIGVEIIKLSMLDVPDHDPEFSEEIAVRTLRNLLVNMRASGAIIMALCDEVDRLSIPEDDDRRVH